MKRGLAGLLFVLAISQPALAQDAVRLTVSSDPVEAAVYAYYPDRGQGGEDVYLGRTPASGEPLRLALEGGPAEVVVAKPGFICKVEPLELMTGSASLEVHLTPDVEVPRRVVLKGSAPFVKDAKESEEIYLAVLAQAVRLYVEEIDPRLLIETSVETLVSILGSIRVRERLLRRELPTWARRRYYGEEFDLRAYPPLVFRRGPAGDEGDPTRTYRLSAGRIGIEGTTDETDLESYLGMLRQVAAFVRHKWDTGGVLSDSVVTRCLIEGLLAALQDEHSHFLDPAEVAEMLEETEGAFGGVGLEVASRDGRMIVVQPIPNTPAARAGLLAGDQIVAIDGQTTSGLTLGEAVVLMRGKVDTPVELTLKRGDRTLMVSILRARVEVRYVAYRLLPGEVGYLRISSFMHEDLDREVRLAMAALMGAGARSLVIDLRDNPGGLLSMARAVADLFVPEGVIVSTRTRLPGESRELRAEARGPKFRLPLAVLINDGSASAAEILAGTLQEHGLATVVGQRSFGKGSVQRVLSLEPYGCALSLTVATYHLPSGRTPNKTGIGPDREVFLLEEDRAALAMRSNYSVEQEPVDAQLADALESLSSR